MLRSGDAFTLTTGEDADMVRAIRRMVAGGVRSRTLQGFDYTARAEARASAPGASPQRARPSGGRAGGPGTGRRRIGHNHLAL
jgi:hypothetical protein